MRWFHTLCAPCPRLCGCAPNALAFPFPTVWDLCLPPARPSRSCRDRLSAARGGSLHWLEFYVREITRFSLTCPTRRKDPGVHPCCGPYDGFVPLCGQVGFSGYGRTTVLVIRSPAVGHLGGQCFLGPEERCCCQYFCRPARVLRLHHVAEPLWRACEDTECQASSLDSAIGCMEGGAQDLAFLASSQWLVSLRPHRRCEPLARR